MAGRYLLIEFDDEASAERLRAQINQATRNGKGFRVVGLFARPGPTFCRCGNWENIKGRPYTPQKRGARFGWQVCLVCRKPVPVMSFLVNLVKPVDIIKPPSYDIQGKQLGFYTYGLTAVSKAIEGFEE
jgi:hypothetical protein